MRLTFFFTKEKLVRVSASAVDSKPHAYSKRMRLDDFRVTLGIQAEENDGRKIGIVIVVDGVVGLID